MTDPIRPEIELFRDFMPVLVTSKIIIIIIVIITLFQEDNIFGTNASLNIWSSDTKTYMRLIITKQ